MGDKSGWLDAGKGKSMWCWEKIDFQVMIAFTHDTDPFSHFLAVGSVIMFGRF